MNSDIVAAAANISYSWPIGQPLGIHQLDNFPMSLMPTSTSYKGDGPASVPGIMRVGLLTGPGLSKDDRSPINKAALRLITNIRSKRSGISSYEAADLIQYINMMDTLYQMYMVSCRLYGTLSLVSQRNYYLPKALVEAQGFNFDDMRKNHSNLRYMIYDMAEDISRWAVPNNLSFINRHLEVFSNVYADANDPKAQLYLYVPRHFYVQKEEDQGATLQGNFSGLWTNGQMGYALWFRAIYDRIERMHLMPHIGQISTDILNYYSDSEVVHVPHMPENYAIQVSYNDLVLYQLRNATVYDEVYNGPDGSLGDISQNNGLVVYNPHLRNRFYHLPGAARILSAPNANPTTMETMEITRLTNCASLPSATAPSGKDKFDGDVEFQLTSFGTEIAVGMEVIYYDDDGTLEFTKIPSCCNGSSSMSQGYPASTVALGLISQFKHHPLIYLAHYDTVSNQMVYEGVDFEFDNYAVIQPEDLDRIHNAALLSEFQIPYYGTWAGPAK
jgi:hypothetical protein